ncbi:hypothetical protein KSB_85260 [Ktedonobacter robiniae]|uniref:Uncharacterized protein n=1 Tax=Ktedonobacter robiniae TaxID=2778365 RepID=A0ABQ3V4F1_9CHLR|nr:hypothetical protein KSB_85260 [Ktedonobacter robiniae]
MAFYGLNLGTRIRDPAHKLAALLLVQRDIVRQYQDIGLPMFARQAFPASYLPPAHARHRRR